MLPVKISLVILLTSKSHYGSFPVLAITYAHAVSSPSSVFCDAQCTVLAYTNVLFVLEVLKSSNTAWCTSLRKMQQFDIHIAYVHAQFLYNVTLYIT